MNNPGKYVFAFEEGDGKDKMLLGGKGANLCEMTRIGTNVPPGPRRCSSASPVFAVTVFARISWVYGVKASNAQKSETGHYLVKAPLAW